MKLSKVFMTCPRCGCETHRSIGYHEYVEHIWCECGWETDFERHTYAQMHGDTIPSKEEVFAARGFAVIEGGSL